MDNYNAIGLSPGMAWRYKMESRMWKHIVRLSGEVDRYQSNATLASGRPMRSRVDTRDNVIYGLGALKIVCMYWPCIWPRVHMAPRACGPACIWPRVHMAPRAYGPTCIWSRVHVVICSKLICVVSLVLRPNFSQLRMDYITCTVSTFT